MADVTTMLIHDVEGDMELALTNDHRLLLRGAQVLEQELREEEFAIAGPFVGKGAMARWLRKQVTSATIDVEHLVERLAKGVPLAEVEKFDLEQDHLVIRLTGFEHELQISARKIDVLELSTMLHFVDHQRGIDRSK